MRKNLMYFSVLFLVLTACDPKTEEEAEMVATQDIELAVDYYDHTLDLENNTETLSYRINYTNPNDFAVKGNARATIQYNYKAETLTIEGTPKPKASSCPEISANESCVDEFYIQSQLDTNSYNPDDLPEIRLISIEYDITEELR